MAETMIYPQVLQTEIEYPESDGEPMAESDFQRIPLTYAVEALGIYFQNRPDVYVSGNILFYYEQGNPRAVISPDVLVAFGVPKKTRRTYLLWKEPKAPDFVLEITSKTTVSQDQGNKKGLYAYLGIREYFLFDPTGDYLEPPLQGYRLNRGVYLPVPVSEEEDGTVIIHSQTLGLDFQVKGETYHFVEPESGRILLNHQESEQARWEAEQARWEAERARWEAEQARWEAERGRSEAEQAQREAEQAQWKAEQRAREETAARLAAEIRVAELEARLQALQNSSKE